MFNRRTFAAILLITLFVISTGYSQSLEDNWNDFLHYTKIGRLDLAKGYARAVLEGNPQPLDLLALSESNPQGYAVLQKVSETASDTEMVELGKKILAIIEEGKFIRRSDPKIIVEEIKRLSGTTRGRLEAVKRLQNAGEYAIPYMLDAMADNSRKEELPNLIWALPQIGKDAIRPLAAALQANDVGVKAEIIKALGAISYPQSLAYLEYVVEKDDSNELRSLAESSISQIDPSALKLPAAQLFYQLAEGYYYHAESLASTEDVNSANMWFWDSQDRRLIREKVDKSYFNELMAMRACELALKANPEFGQAIGLWLAAYLKAESTGAKMPAYFGPGHADAVVYATIAGPEYLHQTLARAINDKNAYIALGAVEALATTAGEKSLFSQIGAAQPLLEALSFDDKPVKYSAAIAIAAAGPKVGFAESRLVVENLAQALGEADLANKWVSEGYALRAAKVMLKLAKMPNPVFDLSAAQEAVVNATRDNRTEIKILACQILARFNNPDAQRSVAAIALAENNPMDIRLSAFDALAVSAKLNGNLLDDEKVDAIYSIVSSKEIDPQLRSTAAAAYGALNLPSQKVKSLILDQARN